MFIKRNYNRKKFLNLTVVVPIHSKTTTKNFSKCLKSIFFSTFIPKEILICVDGSISKSLKKFINNYKNKNIKLLFLKKNVGLGRLLSVAIPKCRFNLIARLDSDEYTNSKRFEIQYNLLAKKKKLVLVGGYSREINKQNITLKKVPLNFAEIINFSQHRNPFNHSTVMFRKKAVLAVGGYKHQPYFEDYLLWIKLIQKKNFMLNLPRVFSSSNIDIDFYKRRKGLEYFKHFLNFNNKVHKMGHINLNTYIINIFIRLSVFLPLIIIRLMYMKFLRYD